MVDDDQFGVGRAVQNQVSEGIEDHRSGVLQVQSHGPVGGDIGGGSGAEVAELESQLVSERRLNDLKILFAEVNPQQELRFHGVFLAFQAGHSPIPFRRGGHKSTAS